MEWALNGSAADHAALEAQKNRSDEVRKIKGERNSFKETTREGIHTASIGNGFVPVAVKKGKIGNAQLGRPLREWGVKAFGDWMRHDHWRGTGYLKNQYRGKGDGFGQRNSQSRELENRVRRGMHRSV